MKPAFMLKIATICGLSLVLSPSCSKVDPGPGTHKGDFTLTGTVRDEISGKPIPYAQAMILQRHRDAGWGGMSVLEKTQCDSLGQFALSFYADTRDYVYSLDATALTYFNKNLDGSDRIDFSKGQSLLQDVTLIPYGYVSLAVMGNKGGHKMNINGAGGPYFIGTDTIVTIITIPNQEFTLPCFIYDIKNNLIKKRIHTPPPPSPHDTTYYLIEF